MTDRNRSEDYLTADEERLLLRIARDSLTTTLCKDELFDPEAYPLTEALRENHGAFVTLHRDDMLRGCIGYTANQRPLAHAVAECAVNAATRDPRFDPVSPEEVPKLHIEVSALTPGDTPETPFKAIDDVDEIVIGRDGLYVERPPARGGLLLPQVATERDWDVETFLAATCRKAGYPETAWQDPAVRIYRFSAQVFAES
jgi:AmmeMemoRadiSam system protein A